MSIIADKIAKYLTDADKIQLENKYKVSREELDLMIKGKRPPEPDLIAEALNIALSNSYILFQDLRQTTPKNKENEQSI